MDNNICSKCGTENEPQYIYCKNCGFPVKDEKTSNAENNQFNGTAGFDSSFTGDSNNFNSNSNGMHIGGIPAEEISIFIGKKSNEIMPKFMKMEFTNSKISWCWPVAVLGILFGPMGAALWFFYRKMPKPAVLLTAIGAVLTVITSLISGFINPSLENVLEDILSSGDLNTLYDSILSIPPHEILLTAVSTVINDLVNISTLIICGIFGFYAYKKHCITKIHELRSIQQNPQFYQFGLSATGGTSGGLLALGLLIMVVVNNASSIVSTVLPLLFK